MTAADAQARGWHINWLAVTGSTTIVRKYYYAGNQRIAMRENGTLRWLLGDHLGSTAYTVNGASEAGEVRYRAFGATRFTSGLTPTSYRYTGQREEVGLGLYYYGARWYDPALGHFIQPDTLIPQAGNVLDYHRYVYVRYNPLKYTDPRGHRCASDYDPWSCSAFTASGVSSGSVPGLSGGEKAALSVATAASTAAALDAGLATGSPPSQADPLPPLLEAFPGQTAGAASTSFPLADGGP